MFLEVMHKTEALCFTEIAEPNDPAGIKINLQNLRKSAGSARMRIENARKNFPGI